MNRVVIAEDNTLFRNALSHSLTSRGGQFEIVGEAADGMEAIRMVERYHPDLLLLDINMPKLNGLSVLERLDGRHPGLKIIVLSLYTSYLPEAIERGANGYCSKDCGVKQLLKAIDQVMHGEFYVCAEG